MVVEGIRRLERRVINIGKSSPAVPTAHSLHFRNRGNKAAAVGKRCLPVHTATLMTFSDLP